MSHRPFDHLSSAHRRLADRHRAARTTKTPSGSSPELRAKLVDATLKLLDERPVSAITTRDIAREAGLSDGVLYNYFADKTELVVAALLRRFDTHLAEFERDLPEPGSGEVEDNLVAFAEAWLGLATSTMPVVVGLMSEPDLAHRFLAEIHGEGYGMRRTFGRIRGYLEAEQELGRLGEFDVGAATTTLVGSTMALAVARTMSGRSGDDERERVRSLVRTLIGGIATQSTGP